MSQQSLKLYRTMLLIRKSEEGIIKYYAQDDMKTPMHMSMGEEAIVAGICAAFTPEDQVLGTYRSHALYLAKTDDCEGFFAELYGKETGGARGKAGSMHLSMPSKGMLGSSAIVASSIPLAMGVAYANRYKKQKNRVAVFFGDGAVDEGVFWESINFAALHKLPVMLVCEDNGLAVHTKRDARHGFDSICEVVKKFKIHVVESDSTDALEIHDLTVKAFEHMDATGEPVFMRLHYYRYLEHVGINSDFNDHYRDEADFLPWKQRDPLVVMRNQLLEMKVPAQTLDAIETEVDAVVQQSITSAMNAKFAPVSEITDGVFAQ